MRTKLGTEAMTPLVTVESDPYNAETPLEIIARKDITPNDSFYVRNHFAVPSVDPKTWKLNVTGDVQVSTALSLSQIREMPSRTILVTLECAGNGRTRMHPVPPSTPWRDGAAATAEWTGVQLKTLLEKARPQNRVVEVLFRGADVGAEGGRDLSFERSLPLVEALNEDVILAYKMNGRPLPKAHGFPLRLIVPDWYGMASVKWLTEIRVLKERFQGYFQKERYIYSNGEQGPQPPVNRIHVKSLIIKPAQDAILKSGKSYKVTGLAWSGLGPVRKVEFRTHGSQWKDTQMSRELGRHAWRRWSTTWTPQRPGRYVLMSRALDKAGTWQPDEPVWNLYGYGHNTVATRNVDVL